MSAKALTPHQKDRLLRLVRRSMLLATERPGRWIEAKECGGPAALEHLYAKGYAEREMRYGPRGGELLYYRPSEQGFAAFDKMIDKIATTYVEREMSAGQIDSMLVEARRRSQPVRIFVGTAEFRAVPGEVERDAKTGYVMLHFGARRVRLAAITKVEA